MNYRNLKHGWIIVGLFFLSANTLLGQQKSWELFKKSPETESPYRLLTTEEATTSTFLQNKGIEVVRMLDSRHFIIKSRPNQTTRQNFEVAAVNNQWKLNRNLSEENSTITSAYIRTKNSQRTIDFLNQQNISFSSLNDHTLKIKASNQQIQTLLLDREEITYIGIESQTPTVETRVIDQNLNPNQVNRIHHEFPNLNGQTLTLSIQEQAYDADDIDLTGRNKPSDISASVTSNHATEMATIAAGAGNTFLTGRGVAKGTTLTSSDFADILPDADADYTNLDVSVQNHSYGTSIENFYGIQAEAYDLSANNNPELLHVFSSGNQGLNADTVGPYADLTGYANLTGNYKMAKNILTVGSVDTVGRSIPFSSKGPAFDGRVKPELVSYSTVGSSNSAALVSGVSILLQQAYKEQSGSLPPSALIKALLINSAEDVGNPQVDYENGYGNMNAYKALQQLQADQFMLNNISSGNQNDHIIAVPPNVQNLKVTLVWNDPAASPNANRALVNDLNLSLTDGSTTWLPWVLDSSPSIASLSAAATRGIDNLNNIEQVTVENPVAGNYTIRINTQTLATTSQAYALVYSWEEKDQFTWTFPTGSDNMPYNGETTGYFRWESTLSASTGILEYSTDNGTTWEMIDNTIDLSTGHYRWQPSEIYTKALARMTVNGTPFLTEEFTISRPIDLDVAFNCTDSLMLRWPGSPSASGYTIYTMGNQELQPVTFTADTSLVIQKNDFITPYFSVEPILNSADTLLPSLTINYNLQSNSCFLISFFPVINGDQLFLQLSLGTTYGIDQIIFERKVNDTFETLAIVTPLNTDLRIEETAPINGPNIHRARIQFLNGATITTEETLIYFIKDVPFVVFPNPVLVGDEIRIYAEDTILPVSEIYFELFNRMGQRVRQEYIFSKRGFIDTFGLESGLYIYRLTNRGAVQTGRVVLYE